MSGVRHADRIYVLHHGRLVEHGTHDQLMAANGRYASMFHAQAAQYSSTSTVPRPASPPPQILPNPTPNTQK
jgi:ATP-binding cassette subfamily B protein